MQILPQAGAASAPNIMKSDFAHQHQKIKPWARAEPTVTGVGRKTGCWEDDRDVCACWKKTLVNFAHGWHGRDAGHKGRAGKLLPETWRRALQTAATMHKKCSLSINTLVSHQIFPHFSGAGSWGFTNLFAWFVPSHLSCFAFVVLPPGSEVKIYE
jgi:hypothetical protein